MFRDCSEVDHNIHVVAGGFKEAGQLCWIHQLQYFEDRLYVWLKWFNTFHWKVISNKIYLLNLSKNLLEFRRTLYRMCRGSMV